MVWIKVNKHRRVAIMGSWHHPSWSTSARGWMKPSHPITRWVTSPAGGSGFPFGAGTLVMQWFFEPECETWMIIYMVFTSFQVSDFSLDALFFLNLVSDYFFHKRVVVLPRLKHGNLIWWTDLYWWDGTLAMKRADGLNQIWQLEKLEALTILNMRNTCKIL